MKQGKTFQRAQIAKTIYSHSYSFGAPKCHYCIIEPFTLYNKVHLTFEMPAYYIFPMTFNFVCHRF